MLSFSEAMKVSCEWGGRFSHVFRQDIFGPPCQPAKTRHYLGTWQLRMWAGVSGPCVCTRDSPRSVVLKSLQLSMSSRFLISRVFQETQHRYRSEPSNLYLGRRVESPGKGYVYPEFFGQAWNALHEVSSHWMTRPG